MIAANLSLSDADHRNLEQFGHFTNLIKARAMGVARKKHVGAYISGRTGIGKTVAVRRVFDEEAVNYQYINCRLSPGGLCDAMRQSPEDIFVLDDVSSLYKNQQGLQVLLAALNGSAGQPRKITYLLKGTRKEPTFQFLGGVVAISNLPLNRDPVADAVASRVRPLEHAPSDEVIASFMRNQALKGFEDLCPTECWEVVDYVINQSKRCEYRLDLRHMEHGWQDYRLWKQGESFGIHWKELIASSMQQMVRQEELLYPQMSKKEEMELHREKVRQARKLFPKDRDRQIEYTGLAERTFGRRLKEVKKCR